MGQRHRVLENMEWHKDADGHKVGLVKSFLVQLNLAAKNANERADTFNAYLLSVQHPGRVEQQSLPGLSGKPPWVASKASFRLLYDFLCL